MNALTTIHERDAEMTAQSCPRLVVLGTGSAGNAYAVSDGTTTLLVDCGFSAREVTRRLEQAGIDASTIAAVFVTHEHGDHVRGIDVFCRRYAQEATVYSSRGTRAAAGLDDLAIETATVRAGDPVRIGTLEATPFRTSHDAAEPFGYRIGCGRQAIGIATDTGVLTEEALEMLAGCEVIGVESNHDPDMLANGPYPAYLKRRIGSKVGHLSNPDAADAVERLAHDGLRHVIALHRSRTNNTERLAGARLVARLSALGLSHVTVTVGSPDAVCDSRPPQGQLFDLR